jgi:endonuclease III
MKKGTLYARKLKKAYASFRGAADGTVLESTDPIEQLILAVLSQQASRLRAQRAFKQLQNDMVDYNELRVSSPAEVSESISRNIPRSVQCAKALLRLLNNIYQREFAVSLESLRGRGIREIKQYLDSLDGISPYVSASVILWSLGGHAIPINDVVHAWLVQQDLVHPEAAPVEVQSFLERHVSAADARGFCLDLEAQAISRGSGSSNGSGGKSESASSKPKAATTTKTKTRKATTPTKRKKRVPR